MGKMKIEEMEAFPPGNPFLHDLSRMGTRLGSNLIAMHEKFDDERQPYIIIVNTDTGERIKVVMP